MGGACSVGVMSRNSSEMELKQKKKKKKKLNTVKSFSGLNKNKKKTKTKNSNDPHSSSTIRFNSGELGSSVSRNFTSSASPGSSHDKVSKGSILGRASFAGIEKAVDVFDALGTGMTNLSSGGFLTGKVAKRNKVSILAFEVANTIARGANLMHSMSEDNVRFIKEDIIPSKAVQHLVSADSKVLLGLAALDKRLELDIFRKEVIRFGRLCKDLQWHNLDRFFARVDSENSVCRQQREQAEVKMQALLTLAQYTSALYHELNAFDRLEQDYRQKVDEMKSLDLPVKGH